LNEADYPHPRALDKAAASRWLEQSRAPAQFEEIILAGFPPKRMQEILTVAGVHRQDAFAGRRRRDLNQAYKPVE
jgi:hypothetical protein